LNNPKKKYGGQINSGRLYSAEIYDKWRADISVDEVLEFVKPTDLKEKCSSKRGPVAVHRRNHTTQETY
jgi:hypothetical protein